MPEKLNFEEYRSSVEAVNNYRRQTANQNNSFSLRIVEQNGKKTLQCYDTRSSDDLAKISLYDRIGTLFHFGNAHVENALNYYDKEFGPLANRVIQSKEEIINSKDEIEDNELNRILHADRHYYSKLSFTGRKKYNKLVYMLMDKEKYEKISFTEWLSQKISLFINTLLGNTSNPLHSKEHHLFVMTQENLNDQASFNFTLKDVFLELIKDKAEPEFEILREGIGKMKTHDIEDVEAQETKKEFDQLGVNENMWIDLSTNDHAMKGRIIRQGENQYLFQMSNTGAGLSLNSDLHKEVWNIKENKPLFQTVLEWGPFNKETLTDEFFEELIAATQKGEFPKDDPVKQVENSLEGPEGEQMKPIMALYSVLRKRFPNMLVDKQLDTDPTFFSTKQIGPSCGPNSFWKLARVILTESQFQELLTDAQISYFTKNYKKIATTKDVDNSVLMRTSELVFKFQESTGKVVHLFQKIGLDLIKQGGGFLEKKLENKTPLDWNNLPEEIVLRKGMLTSIEGSTEINVNYEKVRQEGKLCRFNLELNPAGEPTGLHILAYLLYEAILSGDNTKIESQLTEFVKLIDQYPDPSAVPFGSNGLQQLKAIISLYSDLVFEFQQVDGSLAARQKQLQLSNIAQTLYTVYFAKVSANPNKKDLEWINQDLSYTDQAAYNFYKIADTENYINTQNNLWAKYSRDLRPSDTKNLWIAYQKRNAFWTAKNNIQLTSNSAKLDGMMKRRLDIGNRPPIDENNVQLGRISFLDNTKTHELLGTGSIQVNFQKSAELPITSQTPVGAAYLVYHYACMGDETNLQKAVDHLSTMLKDKETIQQLSNKEIELLIEIAQNMKNSALSLKSLDASVESYSLQQSMILISHALYNIAKKGNLSSKEQEEFKQEHDYYNKALPTSFLNERHPLREIQRSANLLFQTLNK